MTDCCSVRWRINESEVHDFGIERFKFGLDDAIITFEAGSEAWKLDPVSLETNAEKPPPRGETAGVP